jgi:hypothetical protein
MDVISVPEASYPGRVEAELACEMCFKSYQRRAYLPGTLGGGTFLGKYPSPVQSIRGLGYRYLYGVAVVIKILDDSADYM